jgi:hypothetical protein
MYSYYNYLLPAMYGPFLERWADIKGFEDKYSISDYGRVKSRKNGIIKCNHEKNSYTSVTLMDRANNSVRRVDVHVLVAETFIENPENKPEVNHKLGIKNLNLVFEIEWCTTSENAIHSFDFLGRKGPINTNRKNSFIYKKDGIETIAFGLRATAKKLNIAYQAIQRILKGKRKTYKGYEFYR